MGCGDGRDADFRVDVEDSRCRPAAREGLDADAGDHVVVILVRSEQVLLEHNLLAAVACKGVAGAAGARLARGKASIACETRLDDREPVVYCFSVRYTLSLLSRMTLVTQDLASFYDKSPKAKPRRGLTGIRTGIAG